jgi:hypothetical protein
MITIRLCEATEGQEVSVQGQVYKVRIGPNIKLGYLSNGIVAQTFGLKCQMWVEVQPDKLTNEYSTREK